MPGQHWWSGWPGAYCTKCGCEDPMEIALADGDFDATDGTWVSPEKEAAFKLKNVCPS